MKSINSTYSAQFNYYYLLLHTLFIKNQKPKHQTTNTVAKSLWIRHLLILLCTNALVGK